MLYRADERTEKKAKKLAYISNVILERKKKPNKQTKQSLITESLT
jgi:hypothetical protein